MNAAVWAIGADVGGTKVEVAAVDSGGRLHTQVRRPTNVKAGPEGVQSELVLAARELIEKEGSSPVGLGIGVAGQIDPQDGTVLFAPNLEWKDVPLQAAVSRALGVPVLVINDVRAATYGEWLHGAGRGCDDLVCLFVGTGIGGGVVSGGQLLTGCTNSAAELGHTVIDLEGPACTCGNQGCLEAFAGGWAIARQAKEMISADPSSGSMILGLADGQLDAVTAELVSQAAHEGDPLGLHLTDAVARALTVGVASLVNAFNPCRFILGGGIIEGWPELVRRIDQGVRGKALSAATRRLQILPAKLGNKAGAVGAASVMIRRQEKRKSRRTRPSSKEKT